MENRPTKREMYAAMAMQAIILKCPLEEVPMDHQGHLPEEVAAGAVDYADALIKELASRPEPRFFGD